MVVSRRTCCRAHRRQRFMLQIKAGSVDTIIERLKLHAHTSTDKLSAVAPEVGSYAVQAPYRQSSSVSMCSTATMCFQSTRFSDPSKYECFLPAFAKQDHHRQAHRECILDSGFFQSMQYSIQCKAKCLAAAQLMPMWIYIGFGMLNFSRDTLDM